MTDYFEFILYEGDRISIRTTGGGGWGAPQSRDPEHIRQDIINGLITPQQAERDYGVKVTIAGTHVEVMR